MHKIIWEEMLYDVSCDDNYCFEGYDQQIFSRLQNKLTVNAF